MKKTTINFRSKKKYKKLTIEINKKKVVKKKKKIVFSKNHSKIIGVDKKKNKVKLSVTKTISNKKNIVQFSSLGHNGRFGNQLFQYALAREYAEKYNLRLEIPKEWIGKKIFKNIVGEPLSDLFPHVSGDYIPSGEVNINLNGFYQSVESLNLLRRSKLKEWFQIKDEWINLFPKFQDFYISAHIRQGDYISNHSDVFCLIEKESYINHVEKIGFSEKEIVWVQEDLPRNSKSLDRDISFLEDFMTLLNSDILLRANSTFSYWAGILGNAKVYSPIVGEKVGRNLVEFSDGNWEPVYSKKYHPWLSKDYSSLFIKK